MSKRSHESIGDGAKDAPDLAGAPSSGPLAVILGDLGLSEFLEGIQRQGFRTAEDLAELGGEIQVEEVGMAAGMSRGHVVRVTRWWREQRVVVIARQRTISDMAVPVEAALQGTEDAFFSCPITRDIMLDPVLCCDGHSYERRAIKLWFDRENRTSPVTNETLASLIVVPNIALRCLIQAARPGARAEFMRLERERLQEELNRPVNGLGETQLFQAAKNGQLDRVLSLLDQGAVQRASIIGETPLFIAAEMNHLNVVLLLLNRGARVDQCRNDEATPLFIAAQGGHLRVVQALLGHGSDKNRAMDGGATPVFIAAQNGHVDVVRVLLDNRACVDGGGSSHSPVHVSQTTIRR